MVNVMKERIESFSWRDCFTNGDLLRENNARLRLGWKQTNKNKQAQRQKNYK